MKNYMILIWDVLNGSGVEDVLGLIYKAAAHRSIFNVHNFNYSLRSCKLIYTALSILFYESFLQQFYSTASDEVVKRFKRTLQTIPSDYTVATIKQEWFGMFLKEIEDLGLCELIENWANKNCEENQSFRFWYFVYRRLLEPLILMYMSIRLSNFDGISILVFSLSRLFSQKSRTQHCIIDDGTFVLCNKSSQLCAIDRSTFVGSEIFIKLFT